MAILTAKKVLTVTRQRNSLESMFLKKIRLIGFKSFADETIIEPGSGITCVVGPNGCGKSNVVDAVRWVLGEKSARGLRGKSMEDVIFLGAESRKSSGMAEVELVFDNQERMLGVDSDSVSISRRIFLGSQSEYFLNGKRSTRRELERVFLDTGIGKTAYSIMEQGRMSEILKASPEERRSLFDEAAGISRFKVERQETLSRLNDTEQNMLRLQDILKGRKEELDNLERQARKTRQYLKLKEHLDRHDRNLRYLQYNELEEKRRKVEERLEKIHKKRNELLERFNSSQSRAEELEHDNHEQIDAMHQLDRSFHQSLSRISSLEEQLERINPELKERQDKLETLKQRQKSETRQLAAIEKRLQASMQLELNLDEEIKSLRSSSESLAENIKKLEQEIVSSNEQEGQHNYELQGIDESQTTILEDLRKVTHAVVIELEARKKELSQKEKRRVALKESLEERLSRLADLHQRLIAAAERRKTPDEALLSELRDFASSNLSKNFNEYESIESEFRSVLFGKTNLLARKEELDAKMESLATRREQLLKENQRLFERRKIATASLEKERNRRVEMELQIRDFQARRESSQEAREGVSDQLEQTRQRLRDYSEEIEHQHAEIRRSEESRKELVKELEATRKASSKQSSEIDGIKKKIEKVRNEIQMLRERVRKDQESIESLLPELSEQERAAENVAVATTALTEEIYNDFQMSLGELCDTCEKLHLRKESEQSEYRRIKAEIQALGQFNALAIEELARCEEGYRELVTQKEDIEKARKNILSVLDDINQKSKEIFIDTFERIQNNFKEVFRTLFGGGESQLKLTNPDDPISSGIDIMVQPPGKKNSSIALLSGGEQNMTAIALMFATYLVRPSPFCLLDEIDAPLDDNNVNRFLRMLSGFTARSQFLVITHNKLTMAQSSAIFGVTQEEPGVSKVVSVRVNGEISGPKSEGRDVAT